jgi:hypothetical protein
MMAWTNGCRRTLLAESFAVVRYKGPGTKNWTEPLRSRRALVFVVLFINNARSYKYQIRQ